MFMLRNRAPERFGNSVTKGGGSLKGLNAVGKMEKRRLKKKWRKQWEAERAEKAGVTAAEVRASIDRKIEGLRRQVEAERAREWEQMSAETREARRRFEELRDRDFARLQADEDFRRAHERGPREHINATPPPHKEPEPPKARKTVHRLKDSSWDEKE
jgi:hypothetical protein